MKRHLLSPSAQRDLDEIWNYIAKDSEDDADRVVIKIRDAMRKLASMPGMGRRHPDLEDGSLRIWPVYSYLIIYKPEAKPLEVVRVIHGARDIPNLLSGE